MDNQNICDLTNRDKTDVIDWKAGLAVKIDNTETDFESLGSAGQDQILFDISSGHRSGCSWLRYEGCMEWDIYYNVKVNGIEVNFEALTDEEQEEIRWEIALNEIWKGSFECAEPIWGEAAYA